MPAYESENRCQRQIPRVFLANSCVHLSPGVYMLGPCLGLWVLSRLQLAGHCMLDGWIGALWVALVLLVFVAPKLRFR